MSSPDAARTLHLLTRHGSPTDPSRLVDFAPLDPGNRPAPFKRYVGRPPVPLPPDLGTTGASAAAVLSGHGTTAATPFDVVALGRLLFFTAGVTRTSSTAFDETTYFRTAMSAGNLHPVEVYVVCRGVEGVADGVHHFAPLEFGLTALREGAQWTAAPVTVVFSGIPWRTAWKYGERGFRHLYWDAGTMLANLLALADAHGWTARVEVGFIDEAWARLVGVDGVTEFPLALVRLSSGNGDEPPDDTKEPDELDLGVAPISRRPITFPLISEAQRGGDLADASAVAQWRARRIGKSAAIEDIDPLDTPGSPSIENVILRRGSTRLMKRETAPRPLLDWAMGVAARPVPADFVSDGATLLEHDLSIHAVDGVAPGAYRRAADGTLELVRPGDYRPIAQQLCLDQPLGGDSAYTAFHCSDLEDVLDAFGSRGYRAAQLEAGIASGRLSLAAFTLGFGATGLTFFDEAVRHFFATTASPMLVTAVGAPAYRNTPGGGPGHLAELANYDRLMGRLTVQLRRRSG